MNEDWSWLDRARLSPKTVQWLVWIVGLQAVLYLVIVVGDLIGHTQSDRLWVHGVSALALTVTAAFLIAYRLRLKRRPHEPQPPAAGRPGSDR